jgi:Protein of unknown function (DUF2889)
MPLSPPVEREPLHRRVVECRGYRRTDGLWDIEGHITDTKAYSFPNHDRGEIRAGEPLHEMWIRLTIDDDMLVHDVEAVTDASPYRICPGIASAFQVLKGHRIAPGWTGLTRRLLGGVKGCTHLVELLGPVATVAYQTLVSLRMKRLDELPADKRPAVIDSCHAYRSDGEVVARRWPGFYTGTSASPG